MIIVSEICNLVGKTFLSEIGSMGGFSWQHHKNTLSFRAFFSDPIGVEGGWWDLQQRVLPAGHIFLWECNSFLVLFLLPDHLHSK